MSRWNARGAAVILPLAAVLGGVVAATYAEPRDPQQLTVYKGARCECCARWIDHVEKAGYKTKVVDLAPIERIKKQAELGVPSTLNSCHTSVIAGYVIGGHVPAEDIARLLKEKPAITGIAVYAMPSGSPGMESDEPEPYNVMAFTKDSSWVYAKH